MDALGAVDREPIPDRVSIRRETGSQRGFVARLSRGAGALLAHAVLEDEDERRWQIDAALGALRRALFRSPYYREALARAGLSPGDLRTIADLAHFPLLERETWAARWSDLPSLPAGPRLPEGTAVVASSGSTGTPVRVARDRFDQLHMWGVLRFWLRWADVSLPSRPRVVLLCGLPTAMAYSVRLHALEAGALHRVSLRRPRPLDRLRKAAPAVIFSDPEGLHWLAAQPDPPSPRLVLTSAAYFSPAQRSQVEETLGAPVINYYSSTETGPIAWECLRAPGRFHVLLPEVWVESVDGELVVTRLRPSVMPVLRYRTGDAGRVSTDACVCGYRGRTITGFTGRSACLFRRPDGVLVDAWRLAVIVKYSRLRAFRLVQTAVSAFTLEIEGAGGDVPWRLVEALRALGWPSPRVVVTPLRAEDASAKPAPFRSLVG